MTMLLAACSKDPIATAQTDNKDYVVETLFTKDDCTVYRFKDRGYYRYFVKCNTGQSSV